MKVLTRIGYTGEKAMIALEYDCQTHHILLLRTQFRKGKLSIEESKTFQEAQKLQAYLFQWPALPILIRLKNTGAIEKWIPAQTEDKIKAILGVSVENSQDFVYEEIEGLSGKHLLSLIRKEVYIHALQALGLHQDRLLGVYLSEASSCFLLPAWLNYSADIAIRFIGTSIYTWKGGLAEESDYTESIGQKELARELEIEPESLSLYASVLLFYLREKQQISGIPTLHINRQRLRKFQKMAKGLTLSLAFVLCLFVTSFSTLSWFSYQHRQSTQVLQQEKPTLDRIQNVRTSLQEKTAFLSGNKEKTLAPSKIAWYIDQLSAIAPKELGFDRILYQGKNKQLKKIEAGLEPREFDLLIQGESRNAHALTAFSIALAEKNWVQEAEIFHSQYDYRSQRLQFILLVSLGDGKVH